MSDMERMAKKVCELIPGNLHDIPAIEMRPHQFKCERCGHIVKALTKAHERGRKEGLEQGAKIAEDYTFEKETLMSWYAGGQIAKAIRTAKEGK